MMTRMLDHLRLYAFPKSSMSWTIRVAPAEFAVCRSSLIHAKCKLRAQITWIV